MRSFVSIQLPRAARDAIRPTLDALAAQDIRGLRPVPARSAHVTVRFLGDVDSGDLGAVRAALAEAALSARPFRLGLGDVGCFPASGPPSVLWVGIEGDLAGADRLRAAVDGALGPLAPGDGGRGLVPHVTLARLGASHGRAGPEARPGGGALPRSDPRRVRCPRGQPDAQQDLGPRCRAHDPGRVRTWPAGRRRLGTGVRTGFGPPGCATIGVPNHRRFRAVASGAPGAGRVRRERGANVGRSSLSWLSELL